MRTATAAAGESIRSVTVRGDLASCILAAAGPLAFALSWQHEKSCWDNTPGRHFAFQRDERVGETQLV